VYSSLDPIKKCYFLRDCWKDPERNYLEEYKFLSGSYKKCYFLRDCWKDPERNY